MTKGKAMGTNVVDFEMLKFARAIAEEFESKLGSEIKRARSNGFKLTYRLEEEEQIGRGTINVARVRLIPETNLQRTRFHRMGQACIEGRTDYVEPKETFDAIKSAVDVVFELANEAGVLT